MWSGREELARYANGGNNAGVPPRLEHEFIAVVGSSRLPGNESVEQRRYFPVDLQG